MGYVIVTLLFISVVFGLFAGFGLNTDRLHFGWLSFAAFVSAAWFVPMLVQQAQSR